MTQHFRYYLRVRYSECDLQRVVFNSRYNEYVAVAISEFMRATGLRAEFKSTGLGFQWVKQTMEWHSPARFDQVLELTVYATKVGTSSFTIATEIYAAEGDHKRIATAQSVLVLMDEPSLIKRSIDDRYRAKLLHGAPGVVTDHAGFFAPAGGSPS